MHPLWPLLPLAVGLLFAWALLARSARLDTRGYIFRRAPALPIRALSSHDDAWLRGEICPGPDGLLRMPRFGHPCVAYSYKIEERRTRTRRDSKGRTRTESYWATIHSESDTVDFTLDDATGRLLIRLGEADVVEGMLGDSERSGRHRHSGGYLPPGMTVSVLGVREDGPAFSHRGEVPLVVTDHTRESKVKQTDRGESGYRVGAWALAFLGAGTAWMLHSAPIPPGPLPWLGAAGVGCLALAPIWGITTYNRFVRLRQQRKASWRQIDVDLATRAALVPNLVEVVKAYSAHEKELLEQLAALRSHRSEVQAIAGEQAAHNATMGFLALREAHPDLQSNELFLDLHQRLWAIEEKLAASRTLHNRILTEWNDLVESFPTGLMARVLGHGSLRRFAVDRSREPEITAVPEADVDPGT